MNLSIDLESVMCKPLPGAIRALDFCYHEESDSVTLLEAVDMCVTVVAYSADSKRGHQMLVGIHYGCSIMVHTLYIH